MPSSKDKKSKNKLLKVYLSSGSDSDESEHELSYYVKDKVKLMKEILKLIKPKKIKSMAPDCIKDLDIVDINSMLLEELLGISNKRLQYIFNGEKVDRETSSSESEEEKPPIDVISLDDISDDDDEETIEILTNKNEKRPSKSVPKKVKKPKTNIIKVEAHQTVKVEKKKRRRAQKPEENKNLEESDKLMSVLELLELQARARAIRSQLTIENEKKTESVPEATMSKNEGEHESDDDAIIIQIPENNEIVITDSDGEGEGSTSKDVEETEHISNVAEMESNVKNMDADENVTVPEEPQETEKTNEETQEKISNETREKTNKEDSIIHLDDDVVEILDVTAMEIDRKKREDKLLAKIQKIKLVRQKSNKTNLVNAEQNSDEKIQNEDENPKLTIECEESSNEILNSNTNDGVDSKNVKTEESSVKVAINSNNFADNDEIVINLDENEMDGIEND